MFSGIDDPQMGEVQALKGLVHRFGYFGGFAEFAFNSVPAAVIDEKKYIIENSEFQSEISMMGSTV